MKVVQKGSVRVPEIWAATVRAVFRVMDSLASYLVAFVAALVSHKRQRLGDTPTLHIFTGSICWVDASRQVSYTGSSPQQTDLTQKFIRNSSLSALLASKEQLVKTTTVTGVQ